MSQCGVAVYQSSDTAFTDARSTYLQRRALESRMRITHPGCLIDSWLDIHRLKVVLRIMFIGRFGFNPHIEDDANYMQTLLASETASRKERCSLVSSHCVPISRKPKSINHPIARDLAESIKVIFIRRCWLALYIDLFSPPRTLSDLDSRRMIAKHTSKTL